MVVSIILGGLFSVCLGSLWLADRVMKREYEEGEEEQEEVKLAPFLKVDIDTWCPICQYETDEQNGLRLPKVCSDKEKCAVQKPHLHVECNVCKGKFLMKTANGK